MLVRAVPEGTALRSVRLSVRGAAARDTRPQAFRPGLDPHRLGLPPIERRVAAPEGLKTSAEIQTDIAAQMKAQEEAMRKNAPPRSKPPH